MANVIEELSVILGIKVDKKNLSKSQKAISSFTSKLKAVAKVAAAVGTAVGVALARDVEKISNTAKSLGVSSRFLEGFGASIKGIGFDSERAADVIEEMTNKINEIEESLPVKESFAQLGLELKEIKKLKPEEQFKAIANAALAMDNSATARSAVDTLMGGEANKIFGFLRTMGGDIDSIVDKANEFNIQTDNSREGAVQLSLAIRRAWGAITNTLKFAVGLAGKFIAPLITDFTKLFGASLAYAKLNIDKILLNISHAAKILGIAVVLATARILALKVVMIATRTAALLMQAAMLIIPIAIFLAVLAVAALVESIYTFIASAGQADTLVGRLISALKMMWSEFMSGDSFLAIFIGRFLEFIDTLISARQSAIDFASQLLTSIMSAFNAISDLIDSAMDKVSSFFNIFDKVKSVFGAIAASVGINFGGGVDEAGGSQKSLINTTPPLTPTPQINAAGASIGGTQTSNSNTSNAVSNNITVNAGSASAEDVAKEIERVINKQNSIAVANNNTGLAF